MNMARNYDPEPFRRLARPEFLPAMSHLFGERMGTNEGGRLVQKAKESRQIFTENGDARLVRFTGGGIATRLAEREEMIAAFQLLEQRSILLLSQRFERFLEKHFGFIAAAGFGTS